MSGPDEYKEGDVVLVSNKGNPLWVGRVSAVFHITGSDFSEERIEVRSTSAGMKLFFVASALDLVSRKANQR